MGLSPDVIAELDDMPRQLEAVVRLFPADKLGWRPDSWGGSPGEAFSAIEHVCHLRDIEQDGYQVRIQRLLEEETPSLVSIDGDALAKQRRYAEADLGGALEAFRQARRATLDRIRLLDDVQLSRAGEFAEYGKLSLRSLLHYLRSHDQQHLAGLHWLVGKLSAPA